MDRLNVIILLLAFGNFTFWYFSSAELPKNHVEQMKEEVRILEKSLPELQKTFEWVKRVQSALEEVPQEDSKIFLNRTQSQAKAWKFTLQETAQSGDDPVFINLSGVGNYKAVANILRELGRNKAVSVDKLSLLVQDDNLLNARMQMTVRTGPWKGNANSKDLIEPVQEPVKVAILGTVDLFGHEVIPEKPVVGKPKIKYLGFYSGQGKSTGIIEENMKSMLVQPGDRTPSGLIVERISLDFLEVRAAQERGKTWKIPLEKSR
jgi:biopolymer transport protein ExbD